MKKIQIEWRYFTKEGETCSRCSKTRDNLRTALKELKKELGNEIRFEMKETALTKSGIPESNIILINGVPVEKILSDVVRGESACCSCSDLCGEPTDCRTLDGEEEVFEDIPVRLIKRAVYEKLDLEDKGKDIGF